MLPVWELELDVLCELDVLHELDQAAQNCFGAQIVAVAAPH